MILITVVDASLSTARPLTLSVTFSLPLLLIGTQIFVLNFNTSLSSLSWIRSPSLSSPNVKLIVSGIAKPSLSVSNSASQ